MRIVSTLTDLKWKTQFELYTDQLDKLIHSPEVSNREYLKSFGIKASKQFFHGKFEEIVSNKPNEQLQDIINKCFWFSIYSNSENSMQQILKLRKKWLLNLNVTVETINNLISKNKFELMRLLIEEKILLLQSKVDAKEFYSHISAPATNSTDARGVVVSEKFLMISDIIHQIVSLKGDSDEDSLVDDIIEVCENLQDIADFPKIINKVIDTKLHSSLILKMFNSTIFNENVRADIINSFLTESIKHKLYYITYEVLITFWDEIVTRGSLLFLQ